MSTAAAKRRRADRAGILPAGDATQLDARPFRRLGLAHQRPDLPEGRTDAAPARAHLAWPDKAGLVIAFVVAAMSIYASTIVLIAGETLTYGRLNHALAVWAGMAVLAIAGPFWLLMRVVDTITGGPSHRRADRQRRRT